MELVTASDLVVTASLALLLSFLVAKLVSFAIPTDPHTTTTINQLRHVSGDRLTVQTPPTGSSNLQVTTNIETEHNTEEEKEEEETSVDSNVSGDRLTVLQTAPTASKVEFQLPTNVESDHNAQEIEEESNVETKAAESSVTSDIADEVTDVTPEFDPEAVGTDNRDEYTEESKTDCDFVEEEKIIEERNSTENDNSAVEEERDVALDNDDDDDDWEGIERSELEKVFMAATEFVVGNGGGESVGNDVEMELYGLHKIATEGPCRQPQPMALMLSARAKWNAWQKLGNMSPEVAMEQYISLVSDKVPGWIGDTSAGSSEQGSAGSGNSESVGADLSTSVSCQKMMLTDRELEQEKETSAQHRSPLTESHLENNVKK